MRVALLDSGVDASHPDIRKALNDKRIRDARGFPASLDPRGDRNGHGTHGASVFMRTAPHAVLYIARISDDDGNIRDEKLEYSPMIEVLSFHICELSTNL